MSEGHDPAYAVASTVCGNDLGTSDEEGLTSVMRGPNFIFSYFLHLLIMQSKATTIDAYFLEIPKNDW